MSKLLQDIVMPSVAPIQPPSKEEVLKRVVHRIENVSRQAFSNLVKTQREGIDIVWNHPRLTPQEIVDELGERAAKVFQFHGALTEYIKAVSEIDGVQVDLKYPTNAFTIDNGVITVTEDPYVLQ